MAITRLTGGVSPGDPADPRSFPVIFNATADVIDAQGTAITEKVALAGDTMTGLLVAPNVQLGVTTAGSDTVALDFSSDGFVTRTVSGTAVVVSGSAYAAGRTKTVRFVGGAAVASLSVPAGWTFVGSSVGTAIGTASTAILTATAFGATESSVVAAWAESA